MKERKWREKFSGSFFRTVQKHEIIVFEITEQRRLVLVYLYEVRKETLNALGKQYQKEISRFLENSKGAFSNNEEITYNWRQLRAK